MLGMKDKIYKLFLHNIKTTGHLDIIKPYRGISDEILPTLREASFNFVYIDGSHNYSQVVKDLKNSDGLVIDGGYLCGDDLEMQLHEVDINLAKENKEQDFIVDEKTKKLFHPGVAVAVEEFFSDEVSSYEGFWIMQKSGSDWNKVLLNLKI